MKIIIALAAAAAAYAQPAILRYSTFLGGNSMDVPLAMAVDRDGYVYITGQTLSSDFPTTPGAFQAHHAGVPGTQSTIGIEDKPDAFVAKLSADGSKVIYSTYIGGKNADVGRAIAVDAQGNAYIAGTTDSPDFPVTQGAFQTTASFGNPGSTQTHGFVLKLNATGTALVFSTLLAGSSGESVSGVAMDGSQHVYVTGTTSSPDFPVTSGAFQSKAPPASNQWFLTGAAFVSELDATGSKLVYSTYLAGSGGSTASAIAVDNAGNAYVTGSTPSADFPTTPSAFQRKLSGQFAGFVTKLNASGDALVMSTFIAGDKGVNPSAIAIDTQGNAYVTGYTNSPLFPGTPGSYQPGLRATSDAFVTKVNYLGTAFTYSTLIGSNTAGTGIAVDASGNAYVAGFVFGSDLPVTTNRIHSDYAAAPCFHTIDAMFQVTPVEYNCGDAFVSKLDPSGARLLFSTYLGGNDADQATALAVDGSGAIYVAGETLSINFPVIAGAVQTHLSQATCSYWGSPTSILSLPCSDAFLSKIDLIANAPPPPFQIINNATKLPGSIAPGELVSLIGAGIGPATPAGVAFDASGRVSTQLQGTRVLFNGVAAPLTLVSADRIDAVVPFEVSPGTTATVAVERNGTSGPSSPIDVAAALPGIFTANFTGTGGAALLNEDGSFNSPAHPAAPGTVANMWVTGVGAMAPPVIDGQVGAVGALASTASPVTVYVGSQPAQVTYAGTAPTLVSGVAQVNFIVPSVSGDAVPVFVSAGGTTSQAGVSMAVR